MLTRSDGRVILGICTLALLGLSLRLWLIVPPATWVPKAAPVELKGVDLNRASLAELLTLPGIGPVLAERIVRDRLINGPFRSVHELLRVPGIGPKLLEKLRPRVRVCWQLSAADC